MPAPTIRLQNMEARWDGAPVTQIVATDTSADGLLVGLAQVRHVGQRVALVRQVFVLEGHRRKGVATALLGECERIAKVSRCVAVGLLVRLNNGDAQALYQTLGYQYAFQDPEDYIMAKQIWQTPP